MTVADSITAVLVLACHHHLAWQDWWAAFLVLMLSGVASSNLPNTSPKPSPPSLIGSRSSVSPGLAASQPRAMASAAGPAGRVPLNLSGMIRTFIRLKLFEIELEVK